jgi:nitrogen regulatory protein P-II 2
MLEGKADIARAMAAGVFKRRWVMGQSMKFVTAIIKPIRLEAVLETLARLGIHAFTVTETKDYSQGGPTEIYRGLQYTPKFLPMLKIEAAVASDRVENLTEAIVRAAKTGQADDGKIFVFNLERETHMRVGAVAETVDKLGPRQAA